MLTTEQIQNAVFYFFKRLNNSLALECAVIMMPLHKEHTCGYTFKLTAYRGTATDSNTFENVTGDRDTADRLFSYICANNIQPEAFSDAVKKLIPTE